MHLSNRSKVSAFFAVCKGVLLHSRGPIAGPARRDSRQERLQMMSSFPFVSRVVNRTVGYAFAFPSLVITAAAKEYPAFCASHGVVAFDQILELSCFFSEYFIPGRRSVMGERSAVLLLS